MVVGVLRVSKVRSGGGAYYLEVAAGGSGTGTEAAGRWMDSGTPALPLSGLVAAADLDAVLAGETPGSGEVLGTARHRVTVAGFDMTFSAPKSVSLLHALGDGEVAAAVTAGHESAVAAAMSYVERHALAVRRRQGVTGRPVPTTVDGVAAAAFVHRVSRALDPHLHTHVVVANLARGPEGGWSALDGRGVYAHASATDALYHSHLRHELTRRLGVAWDTADRGRADIAGIAPEARREFSRRAAQIAEHLDERGLTSGRARTVAGFATRADKDPHLGADELRPEWQDRARAVGLGPRRLEAVLERVPRRTPSSMPAALEEAGLPATVGQALDDLHRSVTRRDVVRAWCRSLPSGAPAPAVEEAADRLLEELTPEPGHGARRHRPGVAERRHQVPSRLLDRGRQPERATAGDGRRTVIERTELSVLLAGRGIGLDRSGHRQPDLGLGLG
jgi:conjugative relaxase-like TrwC/TraI family protein